MLPKSRKTLNAFLVGEDGKIPKKSIISIGSILASATLLMAGTASANPGWNHSDSVSPKYENFVLTSQHSHHGQHSVHDSGGGGYGY